MSTTHDHKHDTNQQNNTMDHLVSQFRNIGEGTCGTIWSIPGTHHALKTGPSESSLQNDFLIAHTVYEAFHSARALLESHFQAHFFTGSQTRSFHLPRVPEPQAFYRSSDGWVERVRDRFPPCEESVPLDSYSAFKMDLIPPLPAQTRENLIEKYFPTSTQAASLRDPRNRDCLIRVYFGQDPSTKPPSISLRNFEMDQTMARELGVDLERLTAELAVGLAVLHWEARIDGTDAEWVLGQAVNILSYKSETLNPTESSTDTSTAPQPLLDPPQTHLYLLDFDKCRRLSFSSSTSTSTTMYQLLSSVREDPYFPTPSDLTLWPILTAHYLTASALILSRQNASSELKAWPQRFIDRWVEEGRRDVEGNEEEGMFEGWGGDGDDDEEEEEEEEEQEEASEYESEVDSDDGEASDTNSDTESDADSVIESDSELMVIPRLPKAVAGKT